MSTRTTTIPTTIMTIDRQAGGTRSYSLFWRRLLLGLVLWALATGSIVAVDGPGQAADAPPTQAEGTDSRNPEMWTALGPDSDGYLELTFEHLNDFEYEPPPGTRLTYLAPPTPSDQDRPFEMRIPERIRNLHGQEIAILGFMMPMAGTVDALTEFILVRSMMICCYGVAPEMTEWILVEASAGQKIPYRRNIPVVIRGKLEIEEDIDRGFVVSLLKMKADDQIELDRQKFEDFYKRTGVQHFEDVIVDER